MNRSSTRIAFRLRCIGEIECYGRGSSSQAAKGFPKLACVLECGGRDTALGPLAPLKTGSSWFNEPPLKRRRVPSAVTFHDVTSRAQPQFRHLISGDPFGTGTRISLVPRSPSARTMMPSTTDIGVLPGPIRVLPRSDACNSIWKDKIFDMLSAFPDS